MNTKDIEALYQYNRWANTRILDAVSRLAVEDFTKDLRSSFGSVRDTVTHIMFAEWIWLMRWKGVSPKAFPQASDYPNVSLIKARWAEIKREQTEFISGVTDQSLMREVAYVNLKGQPFAYPLWQVLQHVVNHSTYHRGQVTTMLRQLRAEPVPTDLLIFYDTKFE